MKKSTSWVYLTLLLVGIITKTATAQTIKSESETGIIKKEQTALTQVEEIERNPSPETLSQLDLPPRTVSQTDILGQNNPQSTPPVESAQSSPQRFAPRIGGQFTTGPGVGYESSFGGIEGFVPFGQNPGQNLSFLEGRLLISTDDAQLGGNLVVAHRLYNAKSDRTFGGYVAYDIRDTGRNVFNQLGAGIETLGKNWDARINAYIPIGENRQQVAETTVDNVSLSNPIFQGNFLSITRQQQRQISRQYEVAMGGFDAEAGVKILSLGETGELRGFAGFYYLDPPNQGSFVGGRARLEARPNDNLKVGLSLQTDSNFGTTAVLSIGANFPGTRPRGIRKEDSVLARLGESIIRQPNIVVDEQSESETIILPETTILISNPNTGQPWTFRHVNLGIGTGNGTVENPTQSVSQALTLAQPNDIVYVQPGTNSGIPAFTIPDGVQVLSTSPVQQINTVEVGIIQLANSGNGLLPRVTGTVTLGNNTTLSGFEINSIEGSGILGTNINNTTIRDNVISNSSFSNSTTAGQGIFLTNVTGKINIANNSLQGNSETAIGINNNAGQTELTIDTNTLADNIGGIQLQLLGTAQATTQITNNSIANSGNIDILLGETAQTNLTISNNIINNPTSQGINFQAFDNAQVTVVVSNNTISNISGDGNVTGDGMNFGLNQNSRTQLTITGNTIDTASDDGIDLNLFDDAVSEVTISNNRISNTNSEGVGLGNIGIEVDAEGNSQLRLLIQSNTITTSGDQGISIFAGSGGGNPQILTSVRLNTLTDNNISGLATGGFDAQTFDTSRVCLQLQNNTSDRFDLINNSGTFQVEAGTNTGTVNQVATTSAPPFVNCTVP